MQIQSAESIFLTVRRAAAEHVTASQRPASIKLSAETACDRHNYQYILIRCVDRLQSNDGLTGALQRSASLGAQYTGKEQVDWNRDSCRDVGNHAETVQQVC